MKANPDKFQALAVGERTHNERPIFRIGDAQIECEKTVKLLGVEILYLSKFDDQISNICRKALQQINVLKRIENFLNFKSRKSIYHAFIMSNFNFRLFIWHFYSKGKMEKLKKVHFRALKSISKISTLQMKFYFKKLEQLLYIYQVSDILQLKFVKMFMDCLHHT